VAKNKAKRALSVVIAAILLIISNSFVSVAADVNVALTATPSTSYCSPWESITALNDGYDPAHSNDRSHAVYGNWNNPGTTQWVQYDFPQSYTISKCDVYWFDDNQGIDLPASCAFKYWNGSSWVSVSNPVGLGVLGNQYNTTTFTPVTTTRIRLEITAKPNYSTGILEWKVWSSDSGSPPQGGLVAHYKFDESSGSQASDSSGNGKTGTLNGGASWTSGKSGNAVNLSGNSQYVSLPSGIVSGLNDFTVAAWVKLDTRSNWARIFDFGTGTSYYMFLTPSSSSSTVRFAIKNGGSEQQINSTSALPTGVWKHVAVTLSGNTGRLYIDGVLAGTNSNMTIKPSNLPATNLNYIGRSMYSNDPYLDGQVDDFRIYSRALSSNEIADLAGTSGGGDPTGPVVTTPPSWIHSFYKKCVMIHGIPICSTNAVPDAALIKAYYVLDAQLKKIVTDKPDVLQQMLNNRVYVIIVGLNETNSMHPSWAGYNDPSWPRRGGGGNPTTVLEEDCIVPPNDTWRQNFCGLVHEFAHTLLTYGIGDAGRPGADPATYNAIVAAYNAAKAAGKYQESSYDMNNYHEYFTGQSCRWFNANPTNLNVPNASSKTDRQQLQEYDPAIYNILASLYGDYPLPEPWN